MDDQTFTTVDDKIEAARKACEAATDDHRPFARLGALLVQKGDLAEAEAPLRRALELKPGHPATVVRLCEVLIAKPALNEAAEIARQAAATRPRNFDILATMGDIYLAQGDAASAEDAFRRALAIDDTKVPVLRKLARLLEEKDRKLEAALVLARAVVVSNSHVNVRKQFNSLRTDALRSKADASGEGAALDALRRVVLKEPEQIGPALQLVDLLEEQGKLMEAVFHMAGALKLQPEDKKLMRRARKLREQAFSA